MLPGVGSRIPIPHRHARPRPGHLTRGGPVTISCVMILEPELPVVDALPGRRGKELGGGFSRPTARQQPRELPHDQARSLPGPCARPVRLRRHGHQRCRGQVHGGRPHVRQARVVDVRHAGLAYRELADLQGGVGSSVGRSAAGVDDRVDGEGTAEAAGDVALPVGGLDQLVDLLGGHLLEPRRSWGRAR